MLGETAGRPAFIRTVHRYGYAFAGAVESPGRRRRRPSSGAVCWLTSRTQEFLLDEGEHVIGRAPDADVSLGSSSVSRRHARITVARHQATVEDLTLLTTDAIISRYASEGFRVIQ